MPEDPEVLELPTDQPVGKLEIERCSPSFVRFRDELCATSKGVPTSRDSRCAALSDGSVVTDVEFVRDNVANLSPNNVGLRSSRGVQKVVTGQLSSPGLNHRHCTGQVQGSHVQVAVVRIAHRAGTPRVKGDPEPARLVGEHRRTSRSDKVGATSQYRLRRWPGTRAERTAARGDTDRVVGAVPVVARVEEEVAPGIQDQVGGLDVPALPALVRDEEWGGAGPGQSGPGRIELLRPDRGRLASLPGRLPDEVRRAVGIHEGGGVNGPTQRGLTGERPR